MSTYTANIAVNVEHPAVYGTGYDKDKVITPPRYNQLADLTVKANSLESLQEKVKAYVDLVGDLD